jgi:hypothetical protein
MDKFHIFHISHNSYVDEDEGSEEVEDGNSKSATEQLGKHGIKIKIKKHGTARGGGSLEIGGGSKKGGGFGGGLFHRFHIL